MKATSHIRPGYGTVTPFVIVRGAAEFIAFTKRVFDAEELGRMGEDGAIGHAEVRIGDSVVMMFDSKPDWPWTPSFLRVYVPDCDATLGQALEAGATVVTSPGVMPWGDRSCRLRDPFGNLWWVMTHLEDLSPEEEGRRWGDPVYLAALQEHESSEFFPRRPDPA